MKRFKLTVIVITCLIIILLACIQSIPRQTISAKMIVSNTIIPTIPQIQQNNFPITTATRLSLSGSTEQKRALIINELRKYNLSEYEINTFVRLAWAESNFNEGIRNQSGSAATGLLQIMPMTWQGAGCYGDIYFYIDNIRCAVAVYRQAGSFKPWVTF